MFVWNAFGIIIVDWLCDWSEHTNEYIVYKKKKNNVYSVLALIWAYQLLNNYVQL